MSAERSISEAILKITGLKGSVNIFYVNCVVDSVDLSTRTCDCTMIDGNTGTKLPVVMLMSVIDDGILFEPVIGSNVKVIFSQNVEPFVCQYSEIENVTIIARTKIKLNDGSFGGMIQVQPLIDKINSLEKDINDLKTAFSNWVVVASDGGAALKAISSTWAGKQLEITKRNELENTTISHGI